MDSDTLREATERWIDAGVIDPETAAAIREFERDREHEERDRNVLVVALSSMGAVLVGAGLLLYLSINWAALSVATRTAVVVAVPSAAAGAGIALRYRGVPRLGHGCWFLAAAFLGPSAFMLADLHAPGLETEWILLLWATGALPAGHVFDSRPTTAVGLFVTLAAAWVGATGDAAPFVVAFVGTAAVAAGLLVRRRSGRLPGVYRVVGLAPAAAVLLLFGLQEGRYPLDDLGPRPALVGAGVVAAGAIALAIERRYRGGATDADVLAVIAPGSAASVALAVVATTPPLPELASFLLVHATLLGLLVAVVAVGAASGSRALVNLVAVAFLLQVVTFLWAAVADALSGALALVVAGAALLVVGFSLEHGRRRLFDRLDAD